MKTFTQFRSETAKVNEESDLQKKYQEFFQEKLKEYDVKSPAELSDDDAKKFFDEVKTEWAAKKASK